MESQKHMLIMGYQRESPLEKILEIPEQPTSSIRRSEPGKSVTDVPRYNPSAN